MLTSPLNYLFNFLYHHKKSQLIGKIKKIKPKNKEFKEDKKE